MNKARGFFFFFLAWVLTVLIATAASLPAHSANGAEIAEPDYKFRWGEKGCRKRFPVGCGRYWPAPPLKCKYIRWGCPKR